MVSLFLISPHLERYVLTLTCWEVPWTPEVLVLSLRGQPISIHRVHDANSWTQSAWVFTVYFNVYVNFKNGAFCDCCRLLSENQIGLLEDNGACSHLTNLRKLWVLTCWHLQWQLINLFLCLITQVTVESLYVTIVFICIMCRFRILENYPKAGNVRFCDVCKGKEKITSLVDKP